MSHRKRRATKRVLLIEDDRAIAEMFGARLTAAGYLTAMAADGVSGLAFSVALQPDLILLDIGLPRMRGDELLRELRRDPRTLRIPVVVLSNWADDPELMKRLRGLGVLEIVVKSHMTPNALVEAVAHWIVAPDREAV